jgi:ATP-binding cassette subfamily F protein uup
MLGRLATEVLWLDGKGNAKTFAHLDQALAAQMEAEKAELAAMRKASAAASAAANALNAETAKPAAKKKLSYNEQREYDGMEKKIHEAEAAAAAAEKRVNDPAVMGDHVKMTEACHALEEAQGLVAGLYSRWEELEGKMR